MQFRTVAKFRALNRFDGFMKGVVVTVSLASFYFKDIFFIAWFKYRFATVLVR